MSDDMEQEIMLSYVIITYSAMWINSIDLGIKQSYILWASKQSSIIWLSFIKLG
jgi:hypothetical protein